MADNDISYRRILRSSSVMGGAAGITMLFGIIRTKFSAILIGSSGIGLLASYMSIQAVIGTVVGLGLQSSIVNKIASSVAAQDQFSLGRAALTSRRLCWLSGLTGAIATIGLSAPLSQWTFGNSEHVLDVSIIGLSLLPANLAGGLSGVIQGMQRIADLAKINAIVAAVGTLISVGIYATIGSQGIALAILVTSLVQLLVSMFFAQRLPVPKASMTWLESAREAGGLLRLGLVMMWSALMVSVVGYVINTIIASHNNLSALGIYSASYALSSLFVNFVLGAMGADYFPRLVNASTNNESMNRIVNEQMEIGLLLVVPGLLLTLVLAPWMIKLLYTSEFLPAANLLQWFAIGCFIRVLQWPMGFVQLALSKEKIFFLTQTSFTMLNMLLAWVGIRLLGIEGISIAFLCMYLVALFTIFLVTRALTGFSFSAANRSLLIIFIPVIFATVLMTRFLLPWVSVLFGGILTIAVSVYCLRELIQRVGQEYFLVQAVGKIPVIRSIFGL